MNKKFAAFLVCSFATCLGCSSLTPAGKNRLASTSGEPASAPLSDAPTVTQPALVQANRQMRMAAIWNEQVLHVPQEGVVQGFTGRIFFHGANDEPVRVDGELSVYGYDDSRELKSNIPDYKFVFSAEELDRYFEVSQLGPSYSIWLPWENSDGVRTPVSLVPVLKRSDGQVVVGEVARLTLSGSEPIDSSIAKRTIGKFSDRRMQLSGPGQKPTSESISLPREFSRRPLTDAERRRYSSEANRHLDQVLAPTGNLQGDPASHGRFQGLQPTNAAPKSPPTTVSYTHLTLPTIYAV